MMPIGDSQGSGYRGHMETRVALVTGASSGIGRACATHLATCGVRVYGTSRVAPTAPVAFTMLQVDVTDNASL
jgi:NAD(P)-dependent dehydrogenase (short-subunit alcohol dehydrogenase family)